MASPSGWVKIPLEEAKRLRASVQQVRAAAESDRDLMKVPGIQGHLLARCDEVLPVLDEAIARGAPGAE